MTGFALALGTVVTSAVVVEGIFALPGIGTLLQRVAGASVQEIDRLMSELHTLRDMLQSEGARVQREITEYAHLSQSAMQSIKIINDSLSNWKTEGTRARM